MILEVLSKIGFDWKLALANTVNFVVIFLVLKRYFFKPISESIEQRKKKIEENLAFSKMAEEKVSLAMKDRDDILSEAQKKAKHLMEKAEEKGEETMTHFKIEALKEKERIINSGFHDIARKEKEARSKIQEEISDLVVLGAQKLIGEELGEDLKSSFSKKVSSFFQ